MLFNKSIISFVAAIALASSVAAAATGPGSTNPQANQVDKTNVDTTDPAKTGTQATGPPVCSAGTPTCCDYTEPFTSLSPNFQAALKAADSKLDITLPVGVNCNVAGTQACPKVAACCDPIQTQDGLPNVAGNCVSQ